MTAYEPVATNNPIFGVCERRAIITFQGVGSLHHDGSRKDSQLAFYYRVENVAIGNIQTAAHHGVTGNAVGKNTCIYDATVHLHSENITFNLYTIGIGVAGIAQWYSIVFLFSTFRSNRDRFFGVDLNITVDDVEGNVKVVVRV